MSQVDHNILISHIGIAVRDLTASIPVYALLTGHGTPTIEDIPDQKVRVAMFGNHGVPGRIELIAATSDASPVARFLASRGEGLHHICILVDDIIASLARLKESGARLIDESPRIGAEGCRIAFVHPASANGVLIELQEKKK